MRVKVKRSGAVFIGATIFLGVAAANTGNNLLYMVVSAMLSIMLVSGLSSILNISSLEVKIIPPVEVFAGSKAPFRVMVRRRKKFPSFLVRLSSEEEGVLFPIVDREWKEGILHLLFPRRGRVREVKVVLSSDFPLGMFVRSLELSVNTDFEVFPSLKPAPVPASGGAFQRQEGYSREALTKGFDDLKGVKEYSGEPMKLIHWKLTAKKDEILVKDMVSEEKEPVVLTLESVEGDFESRISKLAYLTVKLIEEGYPVGLKIGEREIPPRKGRHQKILILRELALY